MTDDIARISLPDWHLEGGRLSRPGLSLGSKPLQYHCGNCLLSCCHQPSSISHQSFPWRLKTTQLGVQFLSSASRGREFLISLMMLSELALRRLRTAASKQPLCHCPLVNGLLNSSKKEAALKGAKTRGTWRYFLPPFGASTENCRTRNLGRRGNLVIG